MKRSRKVALILMVPASTLLIASCGEEREQALVFSSPEECVQSGLSSPEQCDADYSAAKSIHPQVAPKYTDKYACEADFGVGKCEAAPQVVQEHSSIFMPMMMGFMAGQMLNRSPSNQYSQTMTQQQSSQPNSGTASASGFSSRFNAQPLYKSRNDSQTFRTAGDAPVTTRTGLTSVKVSDTHPSSGKFTSRGGFGTQAAMRGSFGG